MKTRQSIQRTGCLLIFVMACSPSIFAQDWSGRWEGKVNVGVEIRLVFKIAKAGNGYTATFDSPDQSTLDIPCDTVMTSGDSIHIPMRAIGAEYKGHKKNDSLITGSLVQGMSIALDLRKKTADVAKRPQTPKPPFPYRSENVLYYNADRSMQFGGTLTIPNGKGPFPTVILVTGSGSQDRNSTVLEHPLFHVLADHLSRNGVAVLRYDDRGVGETTGDLNLATTADFADDAEAGIAFLLQKSWVDPKRIGIIGHSEGGIIAPMIANRRNDIAFVVLLAAPTVPIIDLMAMQNEAIARSAGLSEEALKEIPGLFTEITGIIRSAPTDSAALTRSVTFIEEWAQVKTPKVLSEMNLASPLQRLEYARGMTGQLRLPWFRWFVGYDPTPALLKMRGKVLALNGAKDIQVISSQNLPALREALKKSKVDQFDIHELPQLNHLFQTCVTCTLKEYGELEETFSPVALQIISDWIKKNIR
jgi:pimeloyl-ACP methyl ester carboxylesterase